MSSCEAETKELETRSGEISRNMLGVPKEFAGCIWGSRRGTEASSNEILSAEGANAKCNHGRARVRKKYQIRI